MFYCIWTEHDDDDEESLLSVEYSRLTVNLALVCCVDGPTSHVLRAVVRSTDETARLRDLRGRLSLDAWYAACRAATDAAFLEE